MQQEAASFGIDWDQAVTSDTSEGVSVDVPEIESPITLEDLNELLVNVPPLSESTEYGIDLYQRAIDFVSSIIMNYNCVM